MDTTTTVLVGLAIAGFFGWVIAKTVANGPGHGSAASAARMRDSSIAKRAVEVQEETQQTLVDLTTQLADISTRVASIERLLKETE